MRIFQRSLRFARESGYLKGRRMKVALDTTNILGRGAAKDTYNLLADGIVQVARALSRVDGKGVKEWGLAHDLEGYFGSSVKGEAGIDWDNKNERQAFLQKIVADADRLLAMARHAQGRFPAESSQRQSILEAMELLGAVAATGCGAPGRWTCPEERGEPDRVPSAHDPQMRHGRKARAIASTATRLPWRWIPIPNW